MTNNFVSRSFYLLVGFLTLRVLEATWVDPDTPFAARRTKALYEGDTRSYALVFSDEFEQDGRTFTDGSDPRWTALRKNDCEYQGILFVGSNERSKNKRGVLIGGNGLTFVFAFFLTK